MSIHPRSVAGALAGDGRIGPNAITRMAEALAVAPALRDAVFTRAGIAHHLAHPPVSMVDDEDVARLHAAAREILGVPAAAAVAREAGRLTGDYLLRHRIPAPAQAVLRRLPTGWAARVLLKAIARHAWTFAGRGRFGYAVFHDRLDLHLAGGPVARHASGLGAPVCDYYGATFERIFRALLGEATRVSERECVAAGHPACVFEVRLARNGRAINGK